MVDRHDLAVADDHVGAALEDRRDELGGVGAVGLVVGVGVGDQVGPARQRRVEPGLETRGQALVVGQTDDVVDAVLAGHADGAVGGAVVDDQPLHGVEAGDLARQVGERGRERGLLVEAGDLDDQLHGPREAVSTVPPRMQRIRVTWPRILLAALALATLVGFFVFPTYPNYDSLYSLIWGREILHGHTPSFEVYRGPTEHPLAIAFAALLTPLGTGADRVMVGATLISFVALVAGLYRLAAAAFTPLVGIVAGALLITRFDFPFLAARGYIDIPYLALVIWAAALEAERPRRGGRVFVLLTLASLMRPEAWLLLGLYWLWYVWPRAVSWSTRIKTALLCAIGPVIWMTVDGAVTGDPLFSLHSTSSLAEELGRAQGLSAVPHATWAFLVSLDKLPVLLEAFAGLALALYLTPLRLGMPLVLLVVGLGTFGLVGVAGLSIINRYLLVPSLIVMVFAAFTLTGWSVLEPGTFVRRAWMVAAAVVVIGGVAYTAGRLNLSHFRSELDFRGAYRTSLRHVMADANVKAGLRCGPVSAPNHKLIPDVGWVADLPESAVVARSD